MNNISKVFNVFIFIMCYEMVLGGLGNIFYFPLRKLLLVIGVCFTVYFLLIKKYKLDKKIIIWIFIFIIYVLYGSLIGILNSNNLVDIISDANVYIGIVYLAILFIYFKNDSHKINKVLNILINGSLIISLITIFLFLYSSIYLPQDFSILDIYTNLNNKLNYGLITGLVYQNKFARVYLFNGIYMQIGCTLLLTKILIYRKIYKLDILKLSVILLGIFTSSTRGFWLGILVSIVLLVIFYLRKKIEFIINKIRLKRLTIFIVGSIGLIIILLGSYSNIKNSDNLNYSEENNIVYTETSGTETFVDRIKSMFDFKKNVSNKVRAVQAKFLLDKIKEKPLIGSGFGTHITEYQDYMKDNNLPHVNSLRFELYYLELMFKTGIIGVGIIISYVIYRIMVLLKTLKKQVLSIDDKYILVGFSTACFSFLVTTFTNPYLASLTGFFILIIEIYIVEFIIRKYGENNS